MSEKKYVIEGNWAVCTDGQIQQGIVVEAHDKTFSTPNSRLIATLDDRFQGNFNCAKIINAAGLIGTIVGAVVGGKIGTAIGGVLGVFGAVVGGVMGASAGSQKGMEIGGDVGANVGGNLGAGIGKGVGAGVGAVQGGTIGAIKGGIDGAKDGAQKGAEVGGDTGSAVGRDVGTGMGSTIGAGVGGTTGAVKGGIDGTIDGAQKGAEKGSTIGREAGTTAGTFVGGGIGGLVGGVAGGATGAVSGAAAGQLAGTVGGIVVGSIAGSVAGSSVARWGMNTFFPNMCSFLTSRSVWSSVHEDMLIEKKTALMPDAILNCFFGGVVSLAIPNMKEAIACAYASMGIYRDPNEDERRPEGEEAPGIIDDILRDFFGKGTPNYYDSDGDNYNNKGGQDHAYFDKYDPRQFEWKEVDSEFAKNIAEKSKVPYITETLVDKDGNPLLDENGNERTGSYFRNDKSGTKVEAYETPTGDIVMVSRGTHNHEKGSSNRDWIDDNGNQGILGNSDQYDEDARIAAATREQMKEDGMNNRFVTTGHSMAGGKTTLSGATGEADTTYAFNPAGVHPDMYAKHGRSAADAANTFVFSSKNDFLTNMSDNLWIAPNHAGKRIVLDTGSGLGDVADSHDMPKLIEAMEKYMAECPDVDLVAHYD